MAEIETVVDTQISDTPPLRVLSWPAFRGRRFNRYVPDLVESLTARGIDVAEFSPVSVLMGRFDILHVHFPDAVLFRRSRFVASVRLALLVAALSILKFRGCRVLWTAHDLDSSEDRHPALESRLWRAFVPRVDAFVSLSDNAIPLIAGRHPCLQEKPRAPLAPPASEADIAAFYGDTFAARFYRWTMARRERYYEAMLRALPAAARDRLVHTRAGAAGRSPRPLSRRLGVCLPVAVGGTVRPADRRSDGLRRSRRRH